MYDLLNKCDVYEKIMKATKKKLQLYLTNNKEKRMKTCRNTK